MKHHLDGVVALDLQMPPTRGHDLKLQSDRGPRLESQMPPTRGHDLKPAVCEG